MNEAKDRADKPPDVCMVDQEFCLKAFEKYRSLVFALGEVVYEHRVPEDIIMWSGELEKTLGYTEKGMGNHTESWLGRVHPEDLPAVKAEFERATQENRVYDLEYRFQHQDGTYLWMHDRGKMEVDQSGKPLKVIGVLRDISGKKRVEEALKKAKEELISANKELQALKNRFHAENTYLQEEIRFSQNVDQIVGQSDSMRHVLEQVEQVASTEATVLILGETGTGKELIARAIHDASRRGRKPLIKVDCAAVPPTLIESEFFGHEKGAFTGATRSRLGRFALADGGTIFLDEVAELPKDVQGKLLRVLQEGEFEPVGSSRTRKVDIRVIAATNRDLNKALQESSFRLDLYYRLSVFPILVPPLRDRGEDIPLLASFFAQRFAHKMGRKSAPLKDECVRELKRYHWPGNVRELQNVIERALITSECNCPDPRGTLSETTTEVITDDSVPPTEAAPAIHTIEQLHQLERENLVLTLKTTGWRVAGERGAARLLGVPPSTLSSRMKTLGIKRPQ